jgi:hypothetical protein
MKRKTTVLRHRHTAGFAQNSSTKSGHSIYHVCSFVVRCNYISFFLCDNIYFHPYLHSSTICLRSLLIVSKLVLVMKIELSINQSINQSITFNKNKIWVLYNHLLPFNQCREYRITTYRPPTTIFLHLTVNFKTRGIFWVYLVYSTLASSFINITTVWGSLN